jgi:hypothetical protein
MNLTLLPTPLSARLLSSARELASYYAQNERRPGTASVIYNLVAEIEGLREAAKGQLIIVQQACKSADLANFKASVLLMIAERIQPVIDAEIEQRQASGHAEDWAQLQALSDDLHAAIKLARG